MLVVEAEVEGDAVESLGTTAERNGPLVVDDNALSGAEADTKDADAAVDGAGRTCKSGVEKCLGGKQ